MPPASPITPETTEVPTETAASASQVERSMVVSSAAAGERLS
jgi:hypothetical protein